MEEAAESIVPVDVQMRQPRSLIMTWAACFGDTVRRLPAASPRYAHGLAERGCRVHGTVRLRALADVAGHVGQHPRALTDTTEVHILSPGRGRASRDRFVSGKSLQPPLTRRRRTDGGGCLEPARDLSSDDLGSRIGDNDGPDR